MRSRTLGTVWTGLWGDNPIFRQVLGICSVLAVTNLVVNCALMGLGLIYTTAFSSLTVSLLRKYTPRRVRMVVQTLIIAAYVILFKLALDAYLPDISSRLGAYVGLIITNCIVMGRCEGFANDNPPLISFVDGAAMGVGYTCLLLVIGVIRELLGFGTLFADTPLHWNVMPEGFTKWTIMVMPPGAFFVLGLLVWAARAWAARREAKKQQVPGRAPQPAAGGGNR